MESKAIRDAQIKASSYHSASFYPWFARLNYAHRWHPVKQRTGDWVQVDLSSVKTVTAVATQGTSLYVTTKYSISYTNDPASFTSYEGGKVFTRNTNGNSIVRNEFVPPIKARFIRLIVNAYSGWPVLRMELYGC